MKKFHKTTYSRQTNFNNFLNSVQESKQLSKLNEYPDQAQKSTQEETYNGKLNSRLQDAIEKKIEIDPSLLFNPKNPPKNHFLISK